MFTWRGPVFHGGQRIYEKLDRAMSKDEWRLMFPDAYVKVLLRVEFSDHHPILINLKDEEFVYQGKPFRFENAWLTNESYNDMLLDTWNAEDPLISNLKKVVDSIDKWKFLSFEKVKRQKKELMKRLEGVQRKLQCMHNTGGMRRQEIKL
ncbi:uncharacterized protein LOC131656434 [Vicia villosa]|uniref:uncharacterized protein LOC131656434 n=1 Tax=Vicia villosa TaxID=3911 RepID=UPI00273B946B|nr:uncharacterized protein LOC131656434 [Vicia villosa]